MPSVGFHLIGRMPQVNILKQMSKNYPKDASKLLLLRNCTLISFNVLVGWPVKWEVKWLAWILCQRSGSLKRSQCIQFTHLSSIIFNWQFINISVRGNVLSHHWGKQWLFKIEENTTFYSWTYDDKILH